MARNFLISEIGCLSARIGEAEHKLATGTDAEKMRATGDLAELKLRAASLRERLHRLGTADGVLDDMRIGLEIELWALAESFEQRLDRW